MYDIKIIDLQTMYDIKIDLKSMYDLKHVLKTTFYTSTVF